MTPSTAIHQNNSTEVAKDSLKKPILTSEHHHPEIIQGGMGVAVSGWQLAQAVASQGMLGVVSGTGIDQVFARRLQHGDPKGIIREAVRAFPNQCIAETALKRYFIEGGKCSSEPYKTPQMFRLDSPASHHALTALAAFVEVWLAKKNHDGKVGINLLEKIALPNPAILYGAMLASVDYVLMGAGVPWQIPGILDQLSRHESVELSIPIVNGLPDDKQVELKFDPQWISPVGSAPITRPNFLAIVSSPTIAQAILKRAEGSVSGFIVESHIAGGHNAPPRGPAKRSDEGEPIYGNRDAIDLSKFQSLGLPFWLAGGQGTSDALEFAKSNGAQGIQVGTLFAFCEESGIDPNLRQQVLESIESKTLGIFTDPDASPTGFPFKVVTLSETLSDEEVYQARNRVCDAGYLRRLCRLPDGELGYICPSEPVSQFLKKGGKEEETTGRKCLCNALLANVGLPQIRADGKSETPLLTAGDDLLNLHAQLGEKMMNYSAKDVIKFLQTKT